MASGQENGHVSVYGPGGLLTGNDALTFSPATRTLTVEKLNVDQVDSPSVDFMGSPMKNVRVESGSLSGVSVVRTQRLHVDGLGSPGTLLTFDKVSSE